MTYLKFILLGAAGLLILASNIAKYPALETIPYGMHVDELSGAATLECLATTGQTFHAEKPPLFATMCYGTPKPPTFLYPGMLWVKMFGFTAAGIRSLSVTFFILALVGLFLLARTLGGNRLALFTLIAASISPWTWSQSRIGIESLHSVTFLVWGAWFLFRTKNWFNLVCSALLISATVYSYPPARAFVPLMLIPLLTLRHLREKLSWKDLALFGAVFAVSLIPLAQLYFSDPVLNDRYNYISIFSEPYLRSIGKTRSLFDIAGVFWNNFMLHLSPSFLLFHGDPNLVHSTGRFGILSWLDMAVLAILVPLTFSKLDKRFAGFMAIIVLIGIVPAALTNGELPHSIRISGGWPFFMLLIGHILTRAGEQWKWVFPVSLVISWLFAAIFCFMYFKYYPQESKGMFRFMIMEQAQAAKTDQQWMDLLYRRKNDIWDSWYYLMRYRGMTCLEARKTWKTMYKIFEKYDEKMSSAEKKP